MSDKRFNIRLEVGDRVRIDPKGLHAHYFDLTKNYIISEINLWSRTNKFGQNYVIAFENEHAMCFEEEVILNGRFKQRLMRLL